MSGDGCFTNNTYKATSVSKVLVYQLSQVIYKVYNTPVSISYCKRKPTTIIEGRIVNQKDTWQLQFNQEIRKQNNAIFINGILWCPIKEIKYIKEYNDVVYNFEVEDDNSYNANNCIVHNCQDLSIAKQNRQGLEGSKSGLFWKYVEALNTIKPKYFLLENVASMKKEDKNIITEALGVEPIRIDSALVSAQQRKRLYWTNIPGVDQPEDKNIKFQSILEKGYTDREKSFCLDAMYCKGGNLRQYFEFHRRQLIFDSIEKYDRCKAEYKEKSIYQGYGWRHLTPLECERLQTVPESYTEGMSKTQRYKMLGNGWTVDVISHILSYIHIHIHKQINK